MRIAYSVPPPGALFPPPGRCGKITHTLSRPC